MMQTRLDKYCSSLCESRTKAQDLIKKGNVKVNGVVIKKASTLLEPEDRVEIVQDDPYVSRAAYKLLGAVENYAINLKEKTVRNRLSVVLGSVRNELEGKYKLSKNTLTVIVCLEIISQAG